MKSFLRGYARFVRLASGFRHVDVVQAIATGQVCKRDYHGTKILWLITNSEDEIQRVQIRKTFYEVPELQYIKDLGRTYDTVIDVGSNIGNHAIFFSKILGARKVYVIEPYPAASNHLLANVALNFPNSIDLTHLGVGLGRIDTTANFVEPTKWNLGLTQLLECADGAIEITTGDKLFHEIRVDLIKIDVEGMECDVIDGFKKTISSSKPDILIEISDNNYNYSSNFLDSIGYKQKKSWRNYENNANYFFEFGEK